MLKHPKILVEIIGGTQPKKRKCRIEGRKVVIKEGAKGRGGAPITAEFDMNCLIPYKAGLPPFRHVKYKLLWKEGTNSCVSFADAKHIEAPTCTKDEVAHFGEATVIKLAGALKPPFSFALVYVLLIILIILVLVAIGVSSGNIRL